MLASVADIIFRFALPLIRIPNSASPPIPVSLFCFSQSKTRNPKSQIKYLPLAFPTRLTISASPSLPFSSSIFPTSGRRHPISGNRPYPLAQTPTPPSHYAPCPLPSLLGAGPTGRRLFQHSAFSIPHSPFLPSHPFLVPF
jgi:hypothetical protein